MFGANVDRLRPGACSPVGLPSDSFKYGGKARCHRVDEILSDIPVNHNSLVFSDLAEDGGCFMDDIIGWMKSLPALQQFLNALLPRLREFGLVRPTSQM